MTTKTAEQEVLDKRVLSKLKRDPTPAIDLSNKLQMQWGTEDSAALRASLLRLQEEGKAEIEYGFGWYKK